MSNTTPIYLAPVDKDFIPHKYIIFVHSQHCDACGSTHKWSEVFGETRLRATMGHGYITNMRPATTMAQVQYNLPIEIRPQQHNIPFCHNCLRPAMLTHKPNIPPPPADARPVLVGMSLVQKAPTRSRWQDKHGNWHIEDLDPADQPKVKMPSKAKASKKFTVDDL